MDRDALRAKFPWLNVDDLVSGAYGASGEGWFDGYGLVQALRKKAQALGARYVASDVTGVVRDGRRITHVVTKDGERYACDTLVNAAARGRVRCPR